MAFESLSGFGWRTEGSHSPVCSSLSVEGPDCASHEFLVYVVSSETVLLMQMQSEGFEVIGTTEMAHLLERIASYSPSLVLINAFGPKEELASLVRDIRSVRPSVLIVMISGDTSWEATCRVFPSDGSIPEFDATVRTLIGNKN